MPKTMPISDHHPMRIYVAGPVTGKPHRNIEAFESAERSIRIGMPDATVLLPHWFVASDADWCKAMRASIETLIKCEAVALLPGWQESRGATIEAEIADALQMAIIELKE